MSSNLPPMPFGTSEDLQDREPIDGVFHFHGEPQRCLYCLDLLVLAVVNDGLFQDGVRQCVGCGLHYSVSLLNAAGTEFILTQPDRFHIDRRDASTLPNRQPVPYVVITDLNAARSVLDARGEE